MTGIRWNKIISSELYQNYLVLCQTILINHSGDLLITCLHMFETWLTYSRCRCEYMVHGTFIIHALFHNLATDALVIHLAKRRGIFFTQIRIFLQQVRKCEHYSVPCTLCSYSTTRSYPVNQCTHDNFICQHQITQILGMKGSAYVQPRSAMLHHVLRLLVQHRIK